MHRRDELVAGDEVHLQGQDAEQQVAVRHARFTFRDEFMAARGWKRSRDIGHAVEYTLAENGSRRSRPETDRLAAPFRGLSALAV